MGFDKRIDVLRCKNERQSKPRLLTVALDGLLQARPRLRRREQRTHERHLFLTAQADGFVLLNDLRGGFLSAVDDKRTQTASGQIGCALEELLLANAGACFLRPVA